MADIESAALDAIDASNARHADRPPDLADALLVWLGTRLGSADIVTIDRDDFSVYGAGHGKLFRNLLKLP